MRSTLITPCLGVFDSGLGGLTVLRELRRAMPDVAMRYVADAAYAPYGERSAEDIRQRSLRIGQHLIDQGAALLVVACNTATAHAIDAMRARWPETPIVGTEPGIKPAAAASRNGRIGVMATPATIASARYQLLSSRHAREMTVISQPCPGLARLIEAGDLESPALRTLVQRLCEPLRAADVDTVLMGCTHYPLIQDLLQAEFGAGVQLLNIETAVAQQASRLWSTLGVHSGKSSITLETSGEAAALSQFVQRVIGWQELSATEVTL